MKNCRCKLTKYLQVFCKENWLIQGIPQQVLRNVPSLKEMIMCYVTNNLDKFPELFDEEYDIIPNPELKTELFEYIEYNFQEEDEDQVERDKNAFQVSSQAFPSNNQIECCFFLWRILTKRPFLSKSSYP